MNAEKNHVPMVEKTLDVIEYIAQSSGSVTLSELRRALRISQPSCYRIVQTLLDRAWLERRNGNGFDIAPALARVAEKRRFRVERYRVLNPILNSLVKATGCSVKYSVRDGEDFVNACAAREPESLLTFSEPGHRCSLSIPGSVSVVFLGEESDEALRSLLTPGELRLFSLPIRNYRRLGYSFMEGSSKRKNANPLDIASFPVFRERELLGVVSFLGLPGSMKSRLDTLMKAAVPFFAVIRDTEI